MNALTFVHIAGGGIALLAGAGALAWRKGGLRHGQAGTLFATAMLVLAWTAMPLSIAKGEYSMLVGEILLAYLVITSWITAARSDAKAGRLEHAGLAVALGCAAAYYAFGIAALNSPTGRIDEFGPPLFFVNGTVAALAAALDLNFILRGTLNGKQRVARHLWRMCVAFFMASGAFFLGQQDTMPDAVRGSLWLFVPALAPLAAMLFWILRVHFLRAFRRGARAAGTAFERVLFPDRAPAPEQAR